MWAVSRSRKRLSTHLELLQVPTMVRGPGGTGSFERLLDRAVEQLMWFSFTVKIASNPVNMFLLRFFAYVFWQWSDIMVNRGLPFLGVRRNRDGLKCPALLCVGWNAIWSKVCWLKRTAHPLKCRVTQSCCRYWIDSCSAMMCHLPAMRCSIAPSEPRRGPGLQLEMCVCSSGNSLAALSKLAHGWSFSLAAPKEWPKVGTSLPLIVVWSRRATLWSQNAIFCVTIEDR